MLFKNAISAMALATIASVLTLIFAFSSHAQPKVIGTSSPAPLAQAPEGKLSRLIIKLKTDGVGKALSQQFDETGKAGIQSLNESRFSSTQGAPVTLNYLKTIHTGIQVATTNEGLSRKDMTSLVETLSQNPTVEFVEIDEVVYPHMMPNDSYFNGFLWNLKSPTSQLAGANFEYAWDRVIGAGTPVNGFGVVVAVIDSGYRPHADLAANILPGYDFIGADDAPTNTIFITANDGDGRDADATDPGNWNTTTANGCAIGNSSWHGTHVAGIIAAVGKNSAGVIGGAYGVKILPVRALGVCGGYTSDIQEGMYWAAGLHQVSSFTNPNIAKVINLSLGSASPCSTSFQTAVTAVVNAGTVVVASTGNDRSTSITSPANCSGVIAVTAHTSAAIDADYANIGTGTTISAPGSNIYSTLDSGTTTPQGDMIGAKSGTSMAAPHVAAAAALLLQVKPTLSPAEIKTLLTSNARAFPSGTNCAVFSYCGAGMLDAYAAVKALQVSEGFASNTAPAMTSSSAQSGYPGVELQFTVTAADAEGNAVTFSASTLPTGATFNSSTGIFHWTNPVLGTYAFTVTPSDASSTGVAQTIDLSITKAPAASQGGGGGGAVDWFALAGLAFLLVFVSSRRAKDPTAS